MRYSKVLLSGLVELIDVNIDLIHIISNIRFCKSLSDHIERVVWVHQLLFDENEHPQHFWAHIIDGVSLLLVTLVRALLIFFVIMEP